jgi:hypothetical protein
MCLLYRTNMWTSSENRLNFLLMPLEKMEALLALLEHVVDFSSLHTILRAVIVVVSNAERISCSAFH